ncbi:nanos RNA binding domain protein [Onchocerca flexuosa]|uniref:Nanos RNA binding domain protein n=1 Tax=Onchocerca flexuosa TaxID=387005 RepID=A0A238BQ57_9BILA|nr:nanos RNA binding domain protein [Onchocerca flexuosa]
MFSLSNLSIDCYDLDDISLPKQLSEVGQPEITNHDVKNNWPTTDWMDQHSKDETRCTASSFPWMSYEKETVNDPRRDGLSILDKKKVDTNYFSTDMITDSSALVSLTNSVPTSDKSSKECYFNTDDRNSWLNETAADITSLPADLTTFLKNWKPSVELIDDNEILQNTTVVAPQKLKDVVPVTSSSFPSLNSLQKNITECYFSFGLSKNQKSQLLRNFILNVLIILLQYEKYGVTIYPELSGAWRTHLCKDSKGVVICPALAAHVCRHCGATGKFAHTEKYCNSQKKRQNQLKNLTWAH